MLKIWLTRAGASKVHTIDMLRNNPEGEDVTIFASRPDPTGPALSRADHVFSEPDWDTSDFGYAQFALDQVRRHRIDVLFPSCRMKALAPYREDFSRLGCHLMVAASEDVARVTDSKTDTYKAAAALGIPVPMYFRVSSSVEFRDAVWAVQKAGHRACVKPDTGWSAGGFRIIDDTEPSLESVFDTAEPTVRLEEYAQILVRAADRGHDVSPLIVLPYLGGPETSIDCLSDYDGRILASVARAKDGVYRRFVEDVRVKEIAHTLVESLPLAGLSNVQTRNLNGQPVLLEVNPRPSAGLFHTRHTGINMYWEAIRLMRSGVDITVPHPRTGGCIAVTEDSVEIS